MKKFKAQGLLAVFVLSAAIAGCGVQGKPGNQTGSAINEPSPSPVATAAPKEREAIIYLTDTELVETVEKSVKLTYETDQDLVEAAIAALQQDAGDQTASLWQPIQVNSVELADGKVTLDIHLPDEARLGAPGELFVIDTLQKTLFQFEFVQAIELLVDGEETESLMGHVELEHPMKKQ